VSHSEQASIRNRNQNWEKLALIAFSRQMQIRISKDRNRNFRKEAFEIRSHHQGGLGKGRACQRDAAWLAIGEVQQPGGTKGRVQSRWGSPASLSSWYRTHGLANRFLWALNLLSLAHPPGYNRSLARLRVLARIFQPQASCPKVGKEGIWRTRRFGGPMQI